VGVWLILIFNAASKLMWIKKLLSGANRNKTCNSADLNSMHRQPAARDRCGYVPGKTSLPEAANVC
jgi:hypothetical protein